VQSWEAKALDSFGEVIIDKSLVRDAGLAARAIPTYVGEWILSHFVQDGLLDDEGRRRVAAFLDRYLPTKGQKEEIKHRLLSGETVRLLDDYSVTVNLRTGQRQLRIPLLDITDAFITPDLVDQNNLLVSSGVWGVGDLFYVPPEGAARGQVWMRSFQPFQIASIDREYYVNCRHQFTSIEWLDLLVSSTGFNPATLSVRQKLLMLVRLIPLVEPRVNIIELAPKGTGKTFVFQNLSRYGRLIAGGRVSPAVLFHNLSTHTAGLITRYDVVVMDEVQSITGDAAGELMAGLKVYLESGQFSRGSTVGTAEAGLAMLGNITLDAGKRPIYGADCLFREMPDFLQETAFLDRLHGLLPGWELPRVSAESPSRSLGFKGDFFSEVLHDLRRDVRYDDFVATRFHVFGSDDLRDRKAISRLAAGLLKLLFPDLSPPLSEYHDWCLSLAVELRQRVRDELHKLDAEYERVAIAVASIPN
jgi:ATP-dependent Lon protease